MNNNISLRELRETDRIISDIFVYFKVHWRKLLVPLLKVLVPFLLLKALVDTYYTINTTINPSGDMIEYFWGSSYIFISTLAGSFLVNLLILSAIKVLDNSGDVSPSQIILMSLRLIFPILVLSILTAIAAFIGFFLFIVPFILVNIIFFYSVVQFTFEGGSLSASIRFAMKLLSGNYWRAFLLLLSLSVIVFLLTWIFALPEQIFEAVYTLHSISGSPGDIKFIIKYLFSILSQLTTLGNLFIWLGVAMHFYSMRERKYGDALLAKLDSELNQ